MSKRLTLFLFASLSAHVLFVLILTLNRTTVSKVNRDEPPLVFDVLEVAPAQAVSFKKSPSRKMLSRKVPSKSEKMPAAKKPERNLNPLLTFQNSFSNRPEKSGTVGKESPEPLEEGHGVAGHGWSEDQFGVGGLRFKNIQDFQQIERLALEADGLLYYPSALARREWSGGVNVKLHFHPEGGCDQKRLSIDSGSQYFRIYILALVKKLCSLPQVERMKLSSAHRVDLNFLFLLMDPSQYQDHPKIEISGNVVMLQRHIINSPIDIPLGPIRIYGPYVAIDFSYLFERWDQYTTGHDPLEEFR